MNDVSDPYVPLLPTHPPPSSLGFGELWPVTTAPDPSLGNVGDLAININNGALYAKENSGWVNIATPGGSGPPVGSAGTFTAGSFNIANGASSGTSPALSLGGTPIHYSLTVVQPSGGFTILANPVSGTETAAGFAYTLSGQTDSANYKMFWVAAF